MMETMDHSEVRELLEDAAIEPGGLDRLMAGDTPTASIVAGHLAGCPDCAEELARLHRSVGLIRPTVRAVPPPELRERTLAYVAALGRPRGPAVEAAVGPAAISRAGSAEAATAAAAAGRPGPLVLAPSSAAMGPAARGQVGRLGWFAGLAAALIVAVTGTALLVNASYQSTSTALSAEIEALGEVARWTLRVDAQPDVRRVELASATGATTSGSLVYSPTSKELVVVADHLAAAPAGHEYRCWVEVDGHRTSIGKMFFGGDLAYWVGDVQAVAGLPAGARFGVSLIALGSSGEPGEPVLTGD
jgi:hypothetical protein